MMGFIFYYITNLLDFSTSTKTTYFLRKRITLQLVFILLLKWTVNHLLHGFLCSISCQSYTCLMCNAIDSIAHTAPYVRYHYKQCNISLWILLSNDFNPAFSKVILLNGIQLYTSAANFSSYFTASQVFVFFFKLNFLNLAHLHRTRDTNRENASFSREQENDSVLGDIFSHSQLLGQIVANGKMTDIIFLFQKGQ